MGGFCFDLLLTNLELQPTAVAKAMPSRGDDSAGNLAVLGHMQGHRLVADGLLEGLQSLLKWIHGA